ncbi:MAG: MOSC N-terminal beta barrel domain-containing protein, partial [Litorivicinus sp.]
MIQKLWVYPLKSGAAVPVDTITLGALGLTGDREYLLTDTDGRFLSARADPVIGQIGFDGVAFHRGQQRAPAAIFDSGLAHAPVSIWKREQPAHRADDATNAWFSALLGKPAVLWRLVPDSALHFGDSQPVMVLNQATADA